MSETTQITIEEYETVNEPLADVEEGDELRVEYESVYGGESTAEGEVVDVEDVYPLANSGECVVITIADESADCMFDEGGTRRVEYITGDVYAVEGRNGGRWNRISELGSDTTVEVATPSTDGGRTEAVAPVEDPDAKVCAGDGCTRIIPIGMFDKCSSCGGLSEDEEREAEALLEEIEDDVELVTDGGVERVEVDASEPLGDQLEEGETVEIVYESKRAGGSQRRVGPVTHVSDTDSSLSSETVRISVEGYSYGRIHARTWERLDYFQQVGTSADGVSSSEDIGSDVSVYVFREPSTDVADEEVESNAHARGIAAQLAMYEDEVEEIRESREEEVDRGDGVATDGSGFVADAEDAEFCSECQRYRIECRHTRSTASDGGVRTTNTSGGRSWDMAEYEARAEELYGETSLTEGEARVAALKELGLSHSEIADELGLAKSTVDENSRRIRRRIEASRRTLEELTPVEDDGVVDAETEHEVAESLGEDRFGFEYVRCTCGMTYPRSAGGCPLEPVELGDDEVDRGDGVETDGGRREVDVTIHRSTDDALFCWFGRAEDSSRLDSLPSVEIERIEAAVFTALPPRFLDRAESRLPREGRREERGLEAPRVARLTIDTDRGEADVEVALDADAVDAMTTERRDDRERGRVVSIDD